jgi:hypothetical protein
MFFFFFFNNSFKSLSISLEGFVTIQPLLIGSVDNRSIMAGSLSIDSILTVRIGIN